MLRGFLLVASLGLLTAGCAQSAALEEGGKPVAEYQRKYWTQFEGVRVGSSEAQVNSAYGQPDMMKLDYGTGVAFFERDKLTHYGVMEKKVWIWTASFNRGQKIVLGDDRFKLNWPIEQPMSQTSFEALVGTPKRRCAYYVIQSFEHVFCYEAGKVVEKSRTEVRPVS